MGHSKILNLLDYLQDSLFLTHIRPRTCRYDLPCEAENDLDEVLSLTLEQFQMLALWFSFVVAMLWIRCTARLSFSSKSPAKSMQHKFQSVYNTPKLHTDEATKFSISFVVSILKSILFHVLCQFHRLGAETRSEKPTRVIAPMKSLRKTPSSSSGIIAAAEPSSLSDDYRYPRGLRRLQSGTPVAEEGHSETAFLEAFVRSRCHATGDLDSTGRVDSRVESCSEVNDSVDAYILPSSDGKGCIQLSVEPHSGWRVGKETCSEPQSGWEDIADVCDKPHSQWRVDEDAYNEPHSDWRVDEGGYNEPHSDWRLDEDAYNEPHSYWTGDIDSCTEAQSPSRGSRDAHIGCHSDMKDSLTSRVTPHYTWKKETVSRTKHDSSRKIRTDLVPEPRNIWKKETASRTEHDSNRKRRTDLVPEPRNIWKKGAECRATPNLGMTKERTSLLQINEYRTAEKVTRNNPTSVFSRSRRNTQPPTARDDSDKKQDHEFDPNGYFHRKKDHLIKKGSAKESRNVNSDEAVSDLLHGDLGTIVSKYYKDKCIGTPELGTVSRNIRTRKMPIPSCEHMKGDGLPVETAVECKVQSVDVTRSFTLESVKRLSMVYNCPGPHNKTIGNVKSNKEREVKQSSNGRKRKPWSHLSSASTKSSLPAWHRKENDSTKPVKQMSHDVTTQTHDFGKPHQTNKHSADLLLKKNHGKSGQESHYDQQSIFSSQSLISKPSEESKTGVGPSQRSQTSNNSDSARGQSVSVIFPNYSTEAVINSLPRREELSSCEHRTSVNGNGYGDSNPRKNPAEIMVFHSKPSKIYTEKRKNQRGRIVRSSKYFRESNKMSTMSNEESDFFGQASSGAPLSDSPLAPNTVFSSTKIKCQVTSNIQRSPHASNVKELSRTEARSKRKVVTMKSIAVQKDICSTSDKHSTAQQTSIQFPHFRHQQVQKSEGIFKVGNSHCPSLLNSGFRKHTDDRHMFTCMSEVLINDSVVTFSSNNDTDKQSVLSQIDVTSWSVNAQSKSSERGILEDVHAKSRKNMTKGCSFHDAHGKCSKYSRERSRFESARDNNYTNKKDRRCVEDADAKASKNMNSDYHTQPVICPTFFSEDWDKPIITDDIRKSNGQNLINHFGCQKVASQFVLHKVADQPGYQKLRKQPHQNDFYSTGYLSAVEESKLEKSTQEHSVRGCSTEKDSLRNLAPIDKNAQNKIPPAKMPQGELFSDRSKTFIAKEVHKRRSLIPRHVKTPPKTNLNQQETSQKAPHPKDAMDSALNTITSRLCGHPRDKSAFKPVVRENCHFGEITNTKCQDTPTISERLPSEKHDRFGVSAEKMQARLGNAYKGKQCAAQTQTKTGCSPTMPKAGGPTRKARSGVKYAQDHHRPVSKRSEKKSPSSPTRHSGFIVRGPKYCMRSGERKKRTNAKPRLNSSKGGNLPSKQSRTKDELPPTQIINIERVNCTGGKQGSEREPNVEPDSCCLKEHSDNDKENGSDIEQADHVQDEASSSHSASQEVSLLTLTTLNYRLVSCSPRDQEVEEADSQKGNSCGSNKNKLDNELSCEILQTSNPEEIIMCPEVEVATGTAIKSDFERKLLSEKETQNEAIPTGRFQAQKGKKPVQSVLVNANMSQTEHGFDPNNDNNRAAKPVQPFKDTTDGNRRMILADATSTRDLKSIKCLLGKIGQYSHNRKSTYLSDVAMDNAKSVHSTKDMSKTKNAYSANAKTINSKHGMRLACRENGGGEHWQTTSSDFNVTKCFRENSRRLCSDLDCNKSNTVDDEATNERRWENTDTCEERDRGTSCTNEVKQISSKDARKRYATREGCLVPQSRQPWKLLPSFSTQKLSQSNLLNRSYMAGRDRESQTARLQKNASLNQISPRAELQNIIKLTCVNNRRNVGLNCEKTTRRECSFTCQHFNLPPGSSQKNNSGFHQRGANDTTRETKVNTQGVRRIGPETIANQKSKNTCTKFRGIQNRFAVKHTENHPTEKPLANTQCKLNTPFYRNEQKLATNRSNDYNTKGGTPHTSSGNKLIGELSQRKNTQDRFRRLHNILKKLPTKNLIGNQTGVSEKRSKYSVTKAAKILSCNPSRVSEARVKYSLRKAATSGQLKSETKPQNAIIKSTYTRPIAHEKECKEIYKPSVTRCAHGSTIGSAADSKQNETLLNRDGASSPATCQWLEVGEPVKCQDQPASSPLVLHNVLGHTESRRFQVQKNKNEFSDSKIHKRSSLAAPSVDNDNSVSLNGIGNQWKPIQHTGTPTVNIVSQLDSLALKIMNTDRTQPNIDASHTGHASENNNIHGHKIIFRLSENIADKNKLAKGPENRVWCGSLRSSMSVSSVGVETAACVFSPVSNTCSMLKVNQLEDKSNYFPKGKCDDIRFHKTKLAFNIQDHNFHSDNIETFNDECDAYMNKQRQIEFTSGTDDPELSGESMCKAFNSNALDRTYMNTQRQIEFTSDTDDPELSGESMCKAFNSNALDRTYMNKQRQIEFTSDTDESELSGESMYTVQEILSNDTLNNLPSNTEIFVLPESVSNSSKEFACGTPAWSLRVNANETDDENLTLRENQLEVIEPCPPETEFLDKKCSVPGSILLPRSCSVESLSRTDTNDSDQVKNLRQISQTCVKTVFREKGESCARLDGNNQKLNSKSKPLFFLKTHSDFTNLGSNIEDSSSFAPAGKANGSIPSSVGHDPVNHWPKKHKVSNQSSISQIKNFPSHHTFSNNRKFNSSNRFAKKRKPKSSYCLRKDGKWNSTYQKFTNNEFKPLTDGTTKAKYQVFLYDESRPYTGVTTDGTTKAKYQVFMNDVSKPYTGVTTDGTTEAKYRVFMNNVSNYHKQSPYLNSSSTLEMMRSQSPRDFRKWRNKSKDNRKRKYLDQRFPVS